MLRQRAAMKVEMLDECHGGKGCFENHVVLAKGDSNVGIMFMNDAIIGPGMSIGHHLHEDSEEIYFVVEGSGTMIMDGVETGIGPGDVSLVRQGHSHGLVNSGSVPLRLLVVCVKP
jgi:mannose-6-phosphate isomerase-like protein (cupin superfamily)